MRTELERAIRLPHATAMVVGTIVGAAIFVQPAEISSLVRSIPGMLAVWAVAGVLTLIGALVCAEFASAIPSTGGVYVYLRESFGPMLGFLWGWSMFWIMHSGIVAAIAVVFARYVGYFVPLGDLNTRLVAVGAIILLSGVNYLGVRQGSTLQTALTVVKLAAIALIVVFGVVLGSRLPDHFVSASGQGSTISLKSFSVALIAGLFAFGGWHMVTYNAEETVDPRRTIPRALMVGTIVVTACYIAMNMVYLYILPLEVVASSTRIAADAADAVMGFGGAALLSVLVIVSTFGALTGIILAGPRVYFSMARDGLSFEWLHAVHHRYRTPHRAILVQAVWAAALVLTGSYRALFTRVIYTEWIFFGLMALGLLLMRRRPDFAPEFRMRGALVLPLVFAFAAFFIVINQVLADPRESLIGLGIVATGIPVFYLWTRTRSVRTPSHHDY